MRLISPYLYHPILDMRDTLGARLSRIQSRRRRRSFRLREKAEIQAQQKQDEMDERAVEVDLRRTTKLVPASGTDTFMK
jgi:hypothetical protein